ncbi:glycosyl hydrolase [Dactylonectria macrodidyma]|uniref:Glycosyl hydrolase n=1 Tax=Dactylonectria macrodidyma TaxID=307937 RepID=A0A9P9EW22_9HYPO|nr:glycosyl hydrolase [Dactylonectria macrodidyma]
MVAQASLNPIIPGFAPDPSAIHVDGWFFVVTSSFHLFPGLPIYASQDLSSWKQIGNAIDRQGQLSLLKSRTSISSPAPQRGGRILPATGGLYAPAIRHHDGTFYIVCTNALREPDAVTAKKENFIISTKDIWKGKWSDPVYFDFEGIDPSITFDDGKVYIQGSAAPGPATRINNFQIDLATGKRLSEERTIWTGMGGVYPEGPHVFKWNGWYYLIIAEGGTHLTHSVTAARSKDIWGPYQPAPNNPILTAYGTDEYIQHTGHCDIFQDADGQWWAVCLAVRKNQERYVLSRETFLTPARWQGEWLQIEPVKSDVKNHAGVQLPSLVLSAAPEVSYVYVRDAQLNRYQFEQGGEAVTLKPSSVDFSSIDVSPTFVAKRQRALQGKATAAVTQLDGAWSKVKVKFGLACYKDEHRFFRVYFDTEDSSVVFDIVNAAQKIARTTRRVLGDVEGLSFSMDYTDMEYTLRYTAGAGSLSTVTLATVDTLEMTDPDFVGPIIGVFAVAGAEGVEVKFEKFSVA